MIHKQKRAPARGPADQLGGDRQSLYPGYGHFASDAEPFGVIATRVIARIERQLHAAATEAWERSEAA